MAYLGLFPGACVSAGAGRRALTKLIAAGEIKPLPLPGRCHMFGRPLLDSYIALIASQSNQCCADRGETGGAPS